MTFFDWIVFGISGISVIAAIILGRRYTRAARKSKLPQMAQHTSEEIRACKEKLGVSNKGVSMDCRDIFVMSPLDLGIFH